LAEVVNSLGEGDEGFKAAAGDVFRYSDNKAVAGCSLL